MSVHQDEGFYLIEVKDFRGYRIENKQRIADGELAADVAIKVRDTFAGLCGARRCDTLPKRISDTFVQALRPEHHVRVVLWLEEDRGVADSRSKPRRADIRAAGRRASLGNKLKRQLRWLDCRILVTSMQDGLPGVAASNLPGAGGAGKRRSV